MRLDAQQLRNRSIARKAAKRYGIDVNLFLRQMNQEAGFQTGLTSSAGAGGPAQIMPGTAKSWGVSNVNDPHEAYDAAAKAMAGYLRSYGGSWAKALTAYNAGPGRVGDSVLPTETQNYIKIILGDSDVRAKPRTPTLGGQPGRVQVTPGRPPRLVPGGTTVDKRKALLDALVAGGDGSLIKRWQGNIASGQYTTTTPPKVEEGKPAQFEPANDGGRPRAPRGRVDASDIHELFWNGPGAVNIKEGQDVGKGFVSGHTDHVHAAFKTPALARRAARLAQSMDLAVREYSPLDHVERVHADGSWHYQQGGRLAMDVSGARMAEFARRLARGRF